MSRVIKFKAWINRDGNPFMEEWNSNFFSDMSEVTGYSSEFPEGDDDVILMQFTGLLDKNGKEIYEGDLIERNETGCEGSYISKYKVVYKESAFVLEVIQSHTWKPGAIVSVMGELTITGNIYENA